MRVSADGTDDGGGWLYLLGRVGLRLFQAVLVTAGVVAIFWLVSPGGGDSKAKAYVAMMKSDLRNLVTAQEAYITDYRVYAPSLQAMGPKYYQPSTGVTVVIDRVAADGFAATATHPGTPFHCAIFVGGVTRPPQIGNAQQGEPRCWKP